MKTISLCGNWRLSGRRQEDSSSQILSLTAEVPGCVQLDLSREGYLPKDLYMGENILKAEEFEDFEWWYKRSFTAPKERERVYLVFEGVDTIAEYYLNGIRIGESRNMLISHEFEIGKYLVDGENTLTVHLLSTVLAANDAEYTVRSMMSWENGAAETAIRRAPHSYGWDIMPRAITAGLWREVRIEVRDRLYFTQLFFKGDAKGAYACYEIDGKWRDLKNAELIISGECEDSEFQTRIPLRGKKAGRAELNINDPKLWWPYGYGEPKLYRARALISLGGEIVHEMCDSFGLRSLRLEHTDTTDGKNGYFRFIINGREIMCKGSNWVPMDAFHSRDAERYEHALSLVKDIGCNILRCWGGNVYEDHTFFDFCDENGIMVWQDFAMACRIYPETSEFKKELEKEATAVVRKLRNHPSIILWSGDNEVDEILKSFTDPDSNSLTREVLPKVVSLNDIGRPYLASSPFYSGIAYKGLKNGLCPPELHVWGPRDYFKSDYYKNNRAHFVSETGYHGCPYLESIKSFITPERVWPYRNNPEWILHSSDQRGDPKRVMLMENQVRRLFTELPTEPERYILASQISQAEAKKYFIEKIRVRRPLTSGIIWWNLLDGWPQMSDAVVDYYYRKKAAYHYIKRSQAPFSVIADEPTEDGLPIYACNDTLKARSGILTVRDADSSETIVRKEFSVGENRAERILTLPSGESDRIFIFEWESDGERGFNHYLYADAPISLDWYASIAEKYRFAEE